MIGAEWGRETIQFATDEYLVDLLISQDVFGHISNVQFVTNKQTYSNGQKIYSTPVSILNNSYNTTKPPVIVGIDGEFLENAYFTSMKVFSLDLDQLTDYPELIDNFNAADPDIGYLPKSRKTWSCEARSWSQVMYMDYRGIEPECALKRTDPRKAWYRQVKEKDLGFSGEEYIEDGDYKEIIDELEWFDIPQINSIEFQYSSPYLGFSVGYT